MYAGAQENAGTIYDLDLTDPENESRNYILKGDDGTYRPLFCRHCDEPECVMSCMSGALQKDPETGIVHMTRQNADLALCV